MRDFLDAGHGVAEQDTGFDSIGQRARQSLDTTIYRVQMHIVWFVHQVVLQTIHRIGVIRFGCQVGMNPDLDIATRALVLDFGE